MKEREKGKGMEIGFQRNFSADKRKNGEKRLKGEGRKTLTSGKKKQRDNWRKRWTKDKKAKVNKSK